MATTSSDTLTPRQSRFVNEYLVDLNGTQAAVRAGYSESGAHVTASRLLKNAKVTLEVRRQQSLIREKVEITSETVVNGLYEIASNPNANDTARVNALGILPELKPKSRVKWNIVLSLSLGLDFNPVSWPLVRMDSSARKLI